MARIGSYLRYFQFTLVFLGIATIGAAVIFPLRFSRWIYLGLALLVTAAICMIIRFLILRAPYTGRNGGVVDPKASPTSWLLGYLMLTVILTFVDGVLLHTYLVAP